MADGIFEAVRELYSSLERAYSSMVRMSIDYCEQGKDCSACHRLL